MKVLTLVKIPDERATPEFIKDVVKRLKAAETPHEARTRTSPVIFEEEFTVMLGGTKDPAVIKEKLRADDFEVGVITMRLLGTKDYMTAIEKVPAPVGIVSGHELGFTKRYSYLEFNQRALASSLRQVISEAAVGFRAVYSKQPVDERVIVASMPLWWRGECFLFCVDNTGEGRYLSSVKITTEERSFEPSQLWLVCRAKQL